MQPLIRVNPFVTPSGHPFPQTRRGEARIRRPSNVPLDIPATTRPVDAVENALDMAENAIRDLVLANSNRTATGPTRQTSEALLAGIHTGLIQACTAIQETRRKLS